MINKKIYNILNNIIETRVNKKKAKTRKEKEKNVKLINSNILYPSNSNRNIIETETKTSISKHMTAISSR